MALPPHFLRWQTRYHAIWKTSEQHLLKSHKVTVSSVDSHFVTLQYKCITELFSSKFSRTNLFECDWGLTNPAGHFIFGMLQNDSFLFRDKFNFDCVKVADFAVRISQYCWIFLSTDFQAESFQIAQITEIGLWQFWRHIAHRGVQPPARFMNLPSSENFSKIFSFKDFPSWAKAVKASAWYRPDRDKWPCLFSTKLQNLSLITQTSMKNDSV